MKFIEVHNSEVPKDELHKGEVPKEVHKDETHKDEVDKEFHKDEVHNGEVVKDEVHKGEVHDTDLKYSAEIAQFHCKN